VFQKWLIKQTNHDGIRLDGYMKLIPSSVILTGTQINLFDSYLE
jgi:hypothetical protein